MRKEGFREAKFFGASMLAAMILIALIALVERGPPTVATFRGASPFNTGPIGTLRLVETLRRSYPQTAAVRSYGELAELLRGARSCLFVTVSPEVGYTPEDAEAVVGALRLCRHPAVLVADEAATSNALLEALGSSARVTGRLLVVPATGAPYVSSLITLPTNRSYALVLDIASEVDPGSASVIGVTLSGEVVATLEEVSGVKVVVLGDGSILLNQVLASNATEYRELVLELVDYLCGGESDCRIAVDGTRYEPLSVEEAMRRGIKEAALYVDPMTLVVLAALRPLHPSSWFIWLVSQFNGLVDYARTSVLLSPLLVLATVFAVYRYTSSRIPRVSDARLEEQREIELYLTGELRDAVLRGRVTLGRQDFLRLFELVDSAVRLTRGVGLCDPEAVKALPPGAAKYARDMCRLYEKASGRRRLPIVLSWSRTTRRMISRSEEFLSALGQSLMKERGVEYLLLR